jgi:peptidoglycan hydrolase CwlO-like protein
MWPALQEARDNAKEIEKEIEKLLKNHNSLSKKEIAKQKELLLEEFAESLATINEQIKELKTNLEKHKKYLEAKSVFMQRHYKRV